MQLQSNSKRFDIGIIVRHLYLINLIHSFIAKYNRDNAPLLFLAFDEDLFYGF